MSDDKKISVSRTIAATPKDIFAVISNPARHAEFDGSGQIVSDEKSDRVTANGQMFTMNMNAEHMGGDYQTDNHVVAYDENKLVGWKTAPAGTQPPGWQWVYTLEPVEQDSTRVSLTYDWSDVTDPDLLAKNLFPLFDEEQLEGSLARLAALLH